MVPCQALRLLFTLYFGTSVEETEPGGSTGDVSVDGEGIGLFARTPASHTRVYARTASTMVQANCAEQTADHEQ